MSHRERFKVEKSQMPPPGNLTTEQGQALDHLLGAIDEEMRKGARQGLTEKEVREIVGQTARGLHRRYRKKF